MGDEPGWTSYAPAPPKLDAAIARLGLASADEMPPGLSVMLKESEKFAVVLLRTDDPRWQAIRNQPRPKLRPAFLSAIRSRERV